MSTASILVVEDDPIVSIDIEEIVRGFGYRVSGSATSGEAAIAAAAEQLPNLILMDIRLDGEIDGIAAAAEINKLYQIPVIYLTAHSDALTLERAKVTEPYGYVLKPLEEIELRIAIELALYRSKSGQTTEDTVAGHSSVSIAPLVTEPLQPASQPRTSTAETTSSCLELLNRISPFSTVARDSLTEFAKQCRLISYKNGQHIALEGDDSADSGFIVSTGRVAMVKTSASGRELIVELLPPGDTFGMVISLESNQYPLTARAQTFSEIMHVPRRAYLQLLSDAPELYRSFVADISRRLRESHDISRAMAHDRVEVRIASALSRLVEKFSSSRLSPNIPTIKITRQELADLTGTTVETAIRATKAMERTGLIDLTDAGIIRIVNIGELQQLGDT